MYEGVLDSLGLVVIGAMFAFLGIIVAVCTFLILRSVAFRPLSSRWRRRGKTAEEEQADNERREKIRTWFWGGR